ncbi:hypothetical protein P8625_08275 [Tenacibaculum tangerinum]|uniref:Lipoprotein n=1 Tax=Tenacibaculum tangerinum TaxID=3038772 RepID=A0ABY8L0F0_9FLAO|nr:hypothetical protein [Tenacibaculum tangerinum]WGH74117.1 hypothetical protein P8625_08275 [Tenacibaculum tangerinum]
MKKLILYFFVVFSYVSCDESKTELFNRGVKELSKNNSIDLNLIDNVVLIPNEGCGGCITSATLFFAKNFDKYESNTIIIFTNVKDIKQLKVTLGKEFLERKNVLVDTEEFFVDSKISSIYPQILKLNNSKVVESEIFDINNFKMM